MEAGKKRIESFHTASAIHTSSFPLPHYCSNGNDGLPGGGQPKSNVLQQASLKPFLKLAVVKVHFVNCEA
jgi:hypothetical protein